MPNVMIGDEKVGGVTLCFDTEDRDQMRELAQKYQVKGISAFIRLLLRAYENHPVEMGRMLEEARQENKKIQSTARKEVLRIAFKKGKIRSRQASISGHEILVNGNYR